MWKYKLFCDFFIVIILVNFEWEILPFCPENTQYRYINALKYSKTKSIDSTISWKMAGFAIKQSPSLTKLGIFDETVQVKFSFLYDFRAENYQSFMFSTNNSEVLLSTH